MWRAAMSVAVDSTTMTQWAAVLDVASVQDLKSFAGLLTPSSSAAAHGRGNGKVAGLHTSHYHGNVSPWQSHNQG
jgi:hypothetical protein